MPLPDEQKLMGVEIEKKRKETTNRVLRAGLAFIYRNGKKICVPQSHPNFVMAKAEKL